MMVSPRLLPLELRAPPAASFSEDGGDDDDVCPSGWRSPRCPLLEQPRGALSEVVGGPAAGGASDAGCPSPASDAAPERRTTPPGSSGEACVSPRPSEDGTPQADPLWASAVAPEDGAPQADSLWASDAALAVAPFVTPKPAPPFEKVWEGFRRLAGKTLELYITTALHDLGAPPELSAGHRPCPVYSCEAGYFTLAELEEAPSKDSKKLRWPVAVANEARVLLVAALRALAAPEASDGARAVAALLDETCPPPLDARTLGAALHERDFGLTFATIAVLQKVGLRKCKFEALSALAQKYTLFLKRLAVGAAKKARFCRPTSFDLKLALQLVSDLGPPELATPAVAALCRPPFLPEAEKKAPTSRRVWLARGAAAPVAAAPRAATPGEEDARTAIPGLGEGEAPGVGEKTA